MKQPDISALAFIPPGKQPEQMHPLVLAYVGDTLHDLYVRQHLVAQPNQRPHHLHRTATRHVSARSQAKTLEWLMPHLTEDEREIVRKGRNAKSATTAKNADVLEYRYSTAFECLLGYLYYKRSYDRLNELMALTIDSVETI